MGRPKGRKDSKKRKVQQTMSAAKARSESAKRAAETRRKRRDEKAASLRSDVETSDVKVTPYPRAGDSPEFVKFVAEQRQLKERAEQAEIAEEIKAERPPVSVELLQVKDVAEWVAWPFMLWAQINDMPSLMLSSTEALELSEPVTAICNRHGVGDLIPPDVLDGLKFAARATPIVLNRFDAIKNERRRRAAAKGDGAPYNPNVHRPHGGGPNVQGAPISAPKEV
jgi:hypothetical protein